MQMNEMDQRRILRDISKRVEAVNAIRHPNRAMELLREFGLCNATIGIALGLTEGVVSCWFTGSKPCPEERQAELDNYLRDVCGLVIKRYEELPEQAWCVFGAAYHKALAYLDQKQIMTRLERGRLSNAAPKLAG